VDVFVVEIEQFLGEVLGGFSAHPDETPWGPVMLRLSQDDGFHGVRVPAEGVQ
jgi:hypothetical protein